LSERAFSLAAFYARVGAAEKERHALRQDLVRGLKDYYTAAYGYDRYGAETVLLLPERMGQPYIFGFGANRVLHDRRISAETKGATARMSIEMIEYGRDRGLPYGLFNALCFLMGLRALDVQELRYALVASATEYDPFRGTEKPIVLEFMRQLVAAGDMPAPERAFWGHTLIARHQDQPGAAELCDTLLGADTLPAELRLELCRAWVNFRQPGVIVDIPEPDGSPGAAFIVEHMPFWVSHAPSLPSPQMVRRGLVWLARLGVDPLEIANDYISYRGAYAEQAHAAVADIVSEHYAAMPPQEVEHIIEQGIGITGSVPARRRFYRLGSDVFGARYLQRATGDSANSVRQWATKQLQKQP
jgi:hypothetical protein